MSSARRANQEPEGHPDHPARGTPVFFFPLWIGPSVGAEGGLGSYFGSSREENEYQKPATHLK